MVVIIVIFVMIPQSREMIIAVVSIFWQSIKELFFKDLIIEKVLCVAVLVIANAFGFYLTKRQKSKVKYFVAGVLNLIGLVGLYRIIY